MVANMWQVTRAVALGLLVAVGPAGARAADDPDFYAGKKETEIGSEAASPGCP